VAPHAACNVLPLSLCLAVLGLTPAPLHSTMAHMENEMTFGEFVANLPLLDWYYDMTDDYQAYLRGSRQIQSYRELAESKGGEWVEAFEKESKKWTI